MLFLNIGYCLVNSVRVFNVFFLNVHIRADFLFWWFVRLVLLYVFIFLHRFAFRWNAVWLKVWCSCFCLFFLSSFFFSFSLCVLFCIHRMWNSRVSSFSRFILMCRVYWLWVFLCVGLSHRVIVFVISFPVISSVVLISDCCVYKGD